MTEDISSPKGKCIPDKYPKAKTAGITIIKTTNPVLLIMPSILEKFLSSENDEFSSFIILFYHKGKGFLI